MSKPQRVKFWEGIRDFSRLTRRARNVDLEAAQDALEIESLAENKLRELIDMPAMAAGFARRDPAETQREGANG